MQAKDVMTAPAITVGPDTSVEEVARVLLDKRVSAVPVVEAAGALVGIVSEGDLMRRAESGTEGRRSWWLSLVGQEPDARARAYVKTHGRHAKDIMSPRVAMVTTATPLQDIAAILEKRHIKRVPVVDEAGRVVGIVSRANLLHGLTVSMARKAPAPGDDALRTALLAAIGDSVVDAHLVTTVVRDGVASLWGMVQTEDEKNAVRVAVENTPGLAAVDNQVGVLPRRFLTTA